MHKPGRKPLLLRFLKHICCSLCTHWCHTRSDDPIHSVYGNKNHMQYAEITKNSSPYNYVTTEQMFFAFFFSLDSKASFSLPIATISKCPAMSLRKRQQEEKSYISVKTDSFLFPTLISQARMCSLPSCSILQCQREERSEVKMNAGVDSQEQKRNRY